MTTELPDWLLFLASSVLNGAPALAATDWSERLARASQDADVSSVKHQLVRWLLTDFGQLTTSAEHQRVIDRVADLHGRVIAGDLPTEAEWRASGAVSASLSRPKDLAAWAEFAVGGAVAQAMRRCIAGGQASAEAAQVTRSASWLKIAQKLLEMLLAAA